MWGVTAVDTVNNPRRSRLFTTSPKKRKSFSANIENCIRLLASPKFRALGLNVWILEESARVAFRKCQSAQLVDTWPLVEVYEASFEAMLEGWPEVEFEAGFEPNSACVACGNDFLVEVRTPPRAHSVPFSDVASAVGPFIQCVWQGSPPRWCPTRRSSAPYASWMITGDVG